MYRNADYWGRPVAGFGDPDARLLVIGLAPAAHGGNRTGRIFTGDRSGDWLFRALFRAGYANQPVSRDLDDGLALTGAWVTGAVKCAPPANRPLTEERDACQPYLEREIALLPDLRAVVVLGSYAYDSLARATRWRGRRPFGHGVEAQLPDGRHVVCSYHPSQQNTFTGRLTEAMLDAVFVRVRELTEAR